MKSKFPSTSSMLQIEAPTKCDEKIDEVAEKSPQQQLKVTRQ
jgi:hypothetical protein